MIGGWRDSMHSHADADADADVGKCMQLWMAAFTSSAPAGGAMQQRDPLPELRAALSLLVSSAGLAARALAPGGADDDDDAIMDGEEPDAGAGTLAPSTAILTQMLLNADCSASVPDLTCMHAAVRNEPFMRQCCSVPQGPPALTGRHGHKAQTPAHSCMKVPHISHVTQPGCYEDTCVSKPASCCFMLPACQARCCTCSPRRAWSASRPPSVRCSTCWPRC